MEMEQFMEHGHFMEHVETISVVIACDGLLWKQTFLPGFSQSSSVPVSASRLKFVWLVPQYQELAIIAEWILAFCLAQAQVHQL